MLRLATRNHEQSGDEASCELEYNGMTLAVREQRLPLI